MNNILKFQRARAIAGGLAFVLTAVVFAIVIIIAVGALSGGRA